jgi:hypothetical protein
LDFLESYSSVNFSLPDKPQQKALSSWGRYFPGSHSEGIIIGCNYPVGKITFFIGNDNLQLSRSAFNNRHVSSFRKNMRIRFADVLALNYEI